MVHFKQCDEIRFNAGCDRLLINGIAACQDESRMTLRLTSTTGCQATTTLDSKHEFLASVPGRLRRFHRNRDAFRTILDIPVHAASARS
jgi:hypothetical protein